MIALSLLLRQHDNTQAEYRVFATSVIYVRIRWQAGVPAWSIVAAKGRELHQYWLPGRETGLR